MATRLVSRMLPIAIVALFLGAAARAGEGASASEVAELRRMVQQLQRQMAEMQRRHEEEIGRLREELAALKEKTQAAEVERELAALREAAQKEADAALADFR